MGFLNSKIGISTLGCLSNTLNFSPGEIAKVPLEIESKIYKDVNIVVKNCIDISERDWNSKELSVNFTENELIKTGISELSKALNIFSDKCVKLYYELYKNEIALNKLFIEFYNFNNFIDPEITLESITILQEESKVINDELVIDPVQVIKQLIHYSIGCIFGRYSLDKPGLILANQGSTLQDFLKQVPNPSFLPDDDNIIPVLDDEWFADDIVGRFKAFLKTAFGEENFEENLNFIEDTLGKDIRKYLVKELYNDHIKRYKKRPIYWMFSSPKGHFKALIYMHRYQQDLCSKMLNDYLQAFISKLEAAKETQNRLSLREDISAREKTLAIKEVDKLEAMIKDCKIYEKTLFNTATQKISIDLDDGVKVNYLKFKEVVVPIKGLEKDEQ